MTREYGHGGLKIHVASTLVGHLLQNKEGLLS